MKNVASMDVELKVEERNLLSVAYKNVIGARRASWRIISSIEHREEGKCNEKKMKMIQEYRQTVKLPANISCCYHNQKMCLGSKFYTFIQDTQTATRQTATAPWLSIIRQ